MDLSADLEPPAQLYLVWTSWYRKVVHFVMLLIRMSHFFLQDLKWSSNRLSPQDARKSRSSLKFPMFKLSSLQLCNDLLTRKLTSLAFQYVKLAVLLWQWTQNISNELDISTTTSQTYPQLTHCQRSRYLVNKDSLPTKRKGPLQNVTETIRLFRLFKSSLKACKDGYNVHNKI